MLISSLASMATFALVITQALPASAHYYSGGVGTSRFSVEITGVNPTWYGHLQHGVTAWNNTYSSSGALLGITGTSNKEMTAGNYSTTWLGQYSPSGTRANRTFLIRANARRIAEMEGSTFSTWARFTSTHELGHALSLADNPNTTSASVMKYVASSGTPGTTPRTHDINDVAATY
jgi:hypothetical protein